MNILENHVLILKTIILSIFVSFSIAALKTQPYDLLRWSAAYFRCLSIDVLPPVKLRYEQENLFGCLTKGYMKVLLNQVYIHSDSEYKIQSFEAEIFVLFMCSYNQISLIIQGHLLKLI